MAHSVPDGDEAQVIERMMDCYIDRYDPLEKAKRARDRKKKKANPEKVSVSSAQTSASTPRGSGTSDVALRSAAIGRTIENSTTTDTLKTTNASGRINTINLNNTSDLANTFVFTNTFDSADTADMEIAYDIDPTTGEIQARFAFGEDSERSRYIEAHVRHAVTLRDQSTGQGGCTWVDEYGNRCGRQHGLEFDHLIPFALGGASTVDNLTLRCRTHNSYRAVQVFGYESVARQSHAARLAQVSVRD